MLRRRNCPEWLPDFHFRYRLRRKAHPLEVRQAGKRQITEFDVRILAVETWANPGGVASFSFELPATKDPPYPVQASHPEKRRHP
jgi:hypothetical protein